MIEFTDLPALNATLNGCAVVLLVTGYWAIRGRRKALHRACMVGACGVSALFLASYLTYHFQVPVTPFKGQGAVRLIYFLLLVPHIILAAVQVPLVLLTLYRAIRGQFDRHRRIARWTLPIWLYVSVTGVLVYMMLYVWFPNG